MRIDFFEEYPTDENLAKARLIDFPTRVYIASSSLAGYEEARARLSWHNPDAESAYWPTPARSHWVSPFSYSAELDALNAEVSGMNKGDVVLIDLELPLIRKKLFLVNLPKFASNKKKIKRIFQTAEKRGVRVVTAEYPAANKQMRWLLEFLGVAYAKGECPHERASMMYSSMFSGKRILEKVKRFIASQSEAEGGHVHVGLGTIAVGVLGNEPILPPDGLESDLCFARSIGAASAIIFRLGGLDEEYLAAIKKFSA